MGRELGLCRWRAGVSMALTRSEQMSRIKGGDTHPEVLLRRALRKGRTGVRIGRIRPDLVLIRPRRMAIFIDGCFWHGCPDHYVRPRSSSAFWANKLLENTSRDARQTSELRSAGWLVVRLWEHEVRENVDAAASRIRRALLTGRTNVDRWRVVEVTTTDAHHERRQLRRLVKPTRWKIEEGPRTTAKLGRVARTVVAEGDS